MAAIRECFKSLKIALNLGPFILTVYRVQPKIGRTQTTESDSDIRENLIFHIRRQKMCIT